MLKKIQAPISGLKNPTENQRFNINKDFLLISWEIKLSSRHRKSKNTMKMSQTIPLMMSTKRARKENPKSMFLQTSK
jgi:hypothetical protein